MRLPLFRKLVFILAAIFYTSNAHTQIDWTVETGLPLGATFVDGQIITNFNGTSLDVRINVTLVGNQPRIHNSDPTRVFMLNKDGLEFSLTIMNGGYADVTIQNAQNLLEGELITITNPDGAPFILNYYSGNKPFSISDASGTTVYPASGFPHQHISLDSITLTSIGFNGGNDYTLGAVCISGLKYRYELSGLADVGAEGFKILSFSECATLPIELVSFKGNCDQLDWAVASEHNSAFFLVEHSSNGTDWFETSIVNAAGESASMKYYSVDVPETNRLTYYRLSQIDFNGEREVFDMITINCFKPTQGYKLYTLLGQEAPEFSKGILLKVYANGTIEKIFLND